MHISVIFTLLIQVSPTKMQNHMPVVFQQPEDRWKLTGFQKRYEIWQKGERNTMEGEGYKIVDGEKRFWKNGPSGIAISITCKYRMCLTILLMISQSGLSISLCHLMP